MQTVYWKQNKLEKITLLQLSATNSDPVWSIVTCIGVLRSGDEVTVTLPFSTLKKGQIKQDIMNYARDENVFVKGLGIIEAVVSEVKHTSSDCVNVQVCSQGYAVRVDVQTTASKLVTCPTLGEVNVLLKDYFEGTQHVHS